MSGPSARYSRHDRPSCKPEHKGRYGEDPCRFLANDELDLAFARIKGLESVALCNFWEAIERNPEYFGGRDEILHAKILHEISERRDELQAQEAADE